MLLIKDMVAKVIIEINCKAIVESRPTLKPEYGLDFL